MKPARSQVLMMHHGINMNAKTVVIIGLMNEKTTPTLVLNTQSRNR